MASTTALEGRYSMAYFVNINGDALVEPLRMKEDNDNDSNTHAQKVKYPPITAKEHLMAKHLASMGETDRSSRNPLEQDEL